jgi:hypothetical protein
MVDTVDRTDRDIAHEPQVPFPGRLAGVKMGSGCLPTPTFPWDLVSPHMSLAPGL